MELKVKVIVDVRDQDQEIVRIVDHVVIDHHQDIGRDHVIARGNEIVIVRGNVTVVIVGITMIIIIVKVVEPELVVQVVEVVVIILLLKLVKDHVHAKEIVQQLQSITEMKGEFFF